MDPIKTLRDDHDRIEKILEQLETLVGRLEEGRAEVCNMVSALREELDGHTYREDCLFPLLASRVGVTGGPVHSIEHDHESVEENLDALVASLDNLQQVSCAGDGIHRSWQVFVEDLRAHFRREESHLFPMALDLLNQSELRVAAEQMESEK